MPNPAYFNLPPEKKQLIRLAVYNEYTSKPFEKVTTRSLIKRTDIAMGSWYQYFENKDEIYLYHICELRNRNLRKLEKYNLFLFEDGRLKIEDSLTPFETQFYETIYDAPDDILRQYYFNQYTPELREKAENSVEKLKEYKLLASSVDTAFAAYYLYTSMFNLVVYCRNNGIKDDAVQQKLVRQQYEILFNSLRP